MWWGIWGKPEVAYGGEEMRGGVRRAVLGGVGGREVKKVLKKSKLKEGVRDKEKQGGTRTVHVQHELFTCNVGVRV